MFWADSIGLTEVVAKIREYGERLDGDHWKLSPLLEKLAAEDGKLHQFSN